MTEKPLPSPLPTKSISISASLPSSFSEIPGRTRAALLQEDVEASPSFHVDLVFAFSTKLSTSFTKRLPKGVAATSLKDRAAAAAFAQTEFATLRSGLEGKGLRVTTRKAKVEEKKNGAKKGVEDEGKVWVFVSASEELVESLRHKEKSNDFLHGVAASPPNTNDAITPAERLRLVYELVTGDTEQGGLAITPGVYPWSHVQSIFALHDKAVNDKWTHSWLGKDWTVGLKIKPHETDLILKHFGPSLALYFSFLSFYTLATLPLSIIGLIAWAFLPTGSYSSIYALAGSFWSVAVVEVWRIKEKSLATQWGMKGVESEEKWRAQSSAAARGRVWWRKDLRVLAGVPVLLLCATALFGVLTSLFIFEAFVTALYDGPGSQYISLAPTLLFAVIVPRILAVYRTIAVRLTDWEDHATEASYQNALTVKTFALNSIVAFGGLLLSAYCYIPFGDQVMSVVDQTLFSASQNIQDAGGSVSEKIGEAGEKLAAAGTPPPGTGGAKAPRGRGVINDGRLQAQVFAYTVTNQIVNAATELVLPIVLRWYAEWRAGDKGKDAQLKKDLDEKRSVERIDEASFLQKVEREALLPEYSLFVDYAEMVTQFGYVALWSICWPLACLPVSVNNYFELRSDALKVCLNVRKPIPSRVSTIGPWLSAMTFLSWLSVLTNSTLYSLFHPTPHTPSQKGFSFLSTSQHAAHDHHSTPSIRGTFYPLLLVALGASHVFFVVRAGIQYVLRKVMWEGSEEVVGGRRREREVRAEYLERHRAQIVEGRKELGASGNGVGAGDAREKSVGEDMFWQGGEGAEVTEVASSYKLE